MVGDSISALLIGRDRIYLAGISKISEFLHVYIATH